MAVGCYSTRITLTARNRQTRASAGSQFQCIRRAGRAADKAMFVCMECRANCLRGHAADEFLFCRRKKNPELRRQLFLLFLMRGISTFIVFENTTHFACISPASQTAHRQTTAAQNQHLGRTVNFKFISSHAILLSTLVFCFGTSESLNVINYALPMALWLPGLLCYDK